MPDCENHSPCARRNSHEVDSMEDGQVPCIAYHARRDYPHHSHGYSLLDLSVEATLEAAVVGCQYWVEDRGLAVHNHAPCLALGHLVLLYLEKCAVVALLI